MLSTFIFIALVIVIIFSFKADLKNQDRIFSIAVLVALVLNLYLLIK
jgi:hypothetical protein